LEDRTVLSPLLFASDSRGRLFTVDVPTGAIDVRGTMARTMLDIAFDPNGSLYGVDARSTLFKIDPNTAATTRIGRVGAFVNALVFAPDGTLYGAGLQLFQIDPATGARTQIGSFQGLRSSGDLAFDGAGTLYMSTSTNRLARVDRSTGAVDVIGRIGARDVFGLAVGPDGIMYGVSNRSEKLVAINLQTGRGTTILRFSGPATSGAFGSSFLEEAVTPSLSLGDAAVREGDTGTIAAVFTVSLSSAVSRPIEVQFTTADETATTAVDYLATSGTLVFAPGQTSQNILVPVNGDGTVELDETFTVNLSAPVNATIKKTQGVGTIQNDDSAILSINRVSRTEGDRGTTSFGFTVTLSSPSDLPVRVHYATADGSATIANNDYEAASGDLAFSPGETLKTITILVNGDIRVELDESFTVNLSAPVNATIGTAQGVAAIENDDSAILRIDSVSRLEGDSGTTPFIFTVTLSNPSDLVVSVHFATANGSATIADNDYEAASGDLTFNPGETLKTITILVNGDIRVELDESFTVNLSAPVNATIGTAQGVAAIENDDSAILRIDSVSRPEGDSGTTPFIFTVTLSNPSDLVVSVHFATANGSATIADNDYEAASGDLTFNPGETLKTITILVNGDFGFESDELFTLDLSAPVNATIGTGQGLATIQNDDSDLS
jgi:hypothetical protein